jgi:hypothetical protein
VGADDDELVVAFAVTVEDALAGARKRELTAVGHEVASFDPVSEKVLGRLSDLVQVGAVREGVVGFVDESRDGELFVRASTPRRLQGVAVA